MACMGRKTGDFTCYRILVPLVLGDSAWLKVCTAPLNMVLARPMYLTDLVDE
jgi:hypothetical protein